MPIRPQDILVDAKAILADAPSEARQRTVASRAYYAAYHFMLNTPRGASFSASKQAGVGMHKQFLDHLKQTSDSRTLQARGRLKRLFHRRILADYQCGVAFTANLAREAIDDAEGIILSLFAETTELGRGT